MPYKLWTHFMGKLNNSIKCNISRVQLLQKRAVRVICGLQYLDSCRPHFKSLQILTVTCLYIFQILLFVRNNLDVINQDQIDHAYDTRNKMNFLRPPKHTTALYEKSVSYAGLKLYNMLPCNVKSLGIREFKNRLRYFLVDHPMYDISELESCDMNLI